MNAKSCCRLFLIASVLSLLPVSASFGDDSPSLTLAQVLARHVQAVGKAVVPDGPKTERETGTIDADGLHGTYVNIHEGGGKYWYEEKLGLEDYIKGSDGKLTWQQDTNGNVRLLSTNERQDDVNDAYIDAMSFARPGPPAGEVSLRPEMEKHTGDYIIDILPPDGKLSALFIDPISFLIVKEQRKDDDLIYTTTFSDFKRINGQMTATTTQGGNGDRKSNRTYHTIDDQLGVSIPDNLFTMPPAPKNYRWVDPTATSATVPFDSADDRIALFVGINGAPAYMILDSGSGGLAISKLATNYLKIPHLGTERSRGYGGSADTYPVKLNTLEIADGIVFNNISAGEIDMNDQYMAYYEATPQVGLIGYDLLSRFVVKVDYWAQEVTISDPAAWQPKPEDGTPLPLEITDNVPSVTAQFDGMAPARFLIDTGDAGCVRLYTPYIMQNAISNKYSKGMDIYGRGIGGTMKDREVRAHSFSLAGVALANVPTYLALDAKGGSSLQLAGALGHQFLSHFTVTFDYPHNRIFFAPNKDTQKPFDTRTFGVGVLRLPNQADNKDHITIYGINPGSPASKTSLADFDVLIKVDGQSADALGLGEVRRLLSADGGKDTRDIEFYSPQGGSGKATLRLYDPLPSTP